MLANKVPVVTALVTAFVAVNDPTLAAVETIFVVVEFVLLIFVDTIDPAVILSDTLNVPTISNVFEGDDVPKPTLPFV